MTAGRLSIEVTSLTFAWLPLFLNTEYSSLIQKALKGLCYQPELHKTYRSTLTDTDTWR